MEHKNLSEYSFTYRLTIRPYTLFPRIDFEVKNFKTCGFKILNEMSDESKDALLTPTHFLPVEEDSLTPPSRGRSFKKVSKSPSSNRATPTILGPMNPKLPDFKPNKKGELVLQKWSDPQTSSENTRENRSRVKAEVGESNGKVVVYEKCTEAVISSREGTFISRVSK